MKKKHFSALSALVCAAAVLTSLTAASCSDKKATPDAQYDAPYIGYTMNYDEETDAGRINVQIPYYHMSDDQTKDVLEDGFADFVLKTANDYILYANPTGFYDYKIDSVVFGCVRNKFVSSFSSGTFTDENSERPEILTYALNASPLSGSVYTTDDLIADFDILADAFKAGKFSLTYGYSDLLKETNYDDLIAGYSSLYSIYPAIYFRDEGDAVKLSMVIELVYDLGGYAEFSIDVDSVKDALTPTCLALLARD